MTEVVPTDVKRVELSHIAAVNSEGVELGRAALGRHNMSQLPGFPTQNYVPVLLPITHAGVATGGVLVDSNGNHHCSGPFHQGPVEVRVGEVIEYPIGGLRFVGGQHPNTIFVIPPL